MLHVVANGSCVWFTLGSVTVKSVAVNGNGKYVTFHGERNVFSVNGKISKSQRKKSKLKYFNFFL